MSRDSLTIEFDEHRERLRSVAYRMLGSHTDAEDAIQETWLRLDHSEAAAIENLGGWLTTVTARICLNMLRTRRTRREEALGSHVPDPIVSSADGVAPEGEAVLADSVGLALLVVLETLEPPERLAFVLHDMFAVPFDEIAEMLDRSSEATRQLASRARRRVQVASVPDVDAARQREVVDAFFAAARRGDLESLVSVLHPDIVLRSDGGVGRPNASMVVRGAKSVARRAIAYSQPGAELRPVLVNGEAGVVVLLDGAPFSVMGFSVAAGRVVAIDVLADPERLGRLDLPPDGRSSRSG